MSVAGVIIDKFTKWVKVGYMYSHPYLQSRPELQRMQLKLRDP